MPGGSGGVASVAFVASEAFCGGVLVAVGEWLQWQCAGWRCGSELLGLCWQCESRLLRLCVCGVRIEAWAWLCGRRGE